MLFPYRLQFTMLVLQRAVKMVWSLREVMRVSCAFMLVMLVWLALWSFGAAGVVASSIGDGGRWWLLVVSWQVLLFISIIGLQLTCYNISHYVPSTNDLI